jgi:Xaa-Pro aminopeptidase
METIQPILKRGRDVWDRINMPEIEFRQRIKTIREAMKKEDLHVLLVYGAGLNEYGNICYLTNYVTKMPMGALVIIPQQGEIVFLFQGGSRELKSVRSITWVEDTRSSMNLPQDCVKHLKESHLVPSRVGIAGLRQLMPFREFQSLTEKINECEIHEADHLIRQMRMVKSPKERDQVRRASRIVARGLNLLSSTALANANERILEAEIDREMRLEGAEDVRLLIGKPTEPRWAMRPAEDIRVSEGDRIIIYAALAFERYWAEAARTYTFKDSRFVELAIESATGVYERNFSGMKPGKSVSQLHDEVLDNIQQSGFEHIPIYGLGQGIGLSLQEYPIINDKDHTPMDEGMCFTLRLAAKNGETGAIMIGDTFLLSESGPERLTI